MFFMWNLIKFFMYPIWRASTFFFSRILEYHSVKFAKKNRRIISKTFFFYFKNFSFSSVYYIIFWSIKINRYPRYLKNI